MGPKHPAKHRLRYPDTTRNEDLLQARETTLTSKADIKCYLLIK